MKLACDLCGGTLQITASGQSAVCTNCGISYSMERLREKLDAQSSANGGCSNPSQDPTLGVKLPPVTPVAAPTRYLCIKRKADLFLCKAFVILDGQQCAILAGWGKETIIPVSGGTHTVSIRVVSGAGLAETDTLTIQVSDRDWHGTFGLERGAIKAAYKFELWECT